MGSLIVVAALAVVGFVLFPLLDRPMSAMLRRRRVRARQRFEAWHN